MIGFPNLPNYGMGAGIGSDIGTLIPPGGKVVAYVRSTGVVSGGDRQIDGRLLTSLNAALAECRSGQGDVVVVLPGHVEALATADSLSNLVAGTQIVGIGGPGVRPKLRWSAAASTVLFDVAGVNLYNMRLDMAGDPALTAALSVAAPITVSAQGCGLYGCDIQTSIDVDQLATVPITFASTGGSDFVMYRCHMFGATAGESTTMMQIIAADGLKIVDSIIEGATSSTTVGVVRFATTASKRIRLDRSIFINRKAASVHAVTGMAALEGSVMECGFGILNDSLLVGLVTPGDLMGFNNRTVNLAGEQGGVTTPIST